MKRKVDDSEISEWQNNPFNNPTTRSDSERKSRAQSRKRTQVRRNEEFNALWPLWLVMAIVGLGAMLYIASKH